MDSSKDTVLELLKSLNESGEHERIEAKAASQIGKSLLETVSAFANEPGLDGGYVLLGVARNNIGNLFDPPQYEAAGVPNPEKVSDDLATQCNTVFNRPVRVRITPVQLDGNTVICVRVPEASPGEKPIYLAGRGLPTGAFRRIGATDQRCTDDDIQILYDARRRSPYDADTLADSSLDDLDPDAIEEYRELRREIEPDTEELRATDVDLLRGLNCVRDANGVLRPTVAGILLFGTSLAIRRCFGMMRVDYIRVPGREWVPDPDERYTSVTIRAPLLRAVRRAEAAVLDDLPMAFHLPEGSLHRRDVPPLPRKVLREAIVNAVMHRDYHVHGAVQIIRYSNRIEIRNPGYSLKAPERLGEPGSETRNPTLAAVFHETNLAETKGTGIRVMRRLMKDAELVPPTFESSRKDNLFSTRLLLHHFLGDDDLAWLDALGETGLSADEKLVLVFVREVGAVDNATYRDLIGVETLRASAALRRLCELNLLEKKGQSTATYYVPGERLSPRRLAPERDAGPSPKTESASGGGVSDMNERKPDKAGAKPSMAAGESSMVPGEPSMIPEHSGTRQEAMATRRSSLYDRLNEGLQMRVDGIGQHADEATMRATIQALCRWQPLSAEEIAALVRRNPDYMKTQYLKRMVKAGELQYTIPEMPKHPNQAYQASEAER